MPEKVLYIITKSNWGGAQRYVYDLATSMATKGFEVSVALGGEGRLKTELEKASIPTYSIKGLQRDVNPLLEFKVFFELISLFRKEKPTIVHLNSSKIGGLGALAARIAGVPRIIFTGHGWAFNENRNWFSKKIILLIHWITILLTHTTIAVSEKTAKDVSWLPFVKHKIKVVYNGMNSYDLLGAEEARVFLIPTHTENTWIGTISELHPTKGLITALEGFKKVIPQFPSAIFVVIGEGEQRKELEHYIQKESLHDNVFLLGAIPDAKKYLKAFNIFTLTSITEALPYAPIEAGFASRPVIATKVGGIPEIITDESKGILIASKDSDAFAHALTSFLENPEEALKKGMSLNTYVTETFSLENMVTKTIAIYKI